MARVVRFVYVFRMTGTDFYKIGTTGDTTKRLNQLQTGSPFPLKVEHEFDFGWAADRVETFLHAEFAGRRMSGEWFHLDEDDVRHLNHRIHSLHCTHTSKQDGHTLLDLEEAFHWDSITEITKAVFAFMFEHQDVDVAMGHIRQQLDDLGEYIGIIDVETYNRATSSDGGSE